MYAGAQADARNSAIQRRTPAGSVDVDQFDSFGTTESVVILIAPQPNPAQCLHRATLDPVDAASRNIQLFEQVALTRERIDLRRKYKRRQPIVAAIYFCISVPVASRKVERRKRRSGAPEISHIAERIHIQHCKVRAVTAIKVHHLSRPIDALQAAAIGNSQLPNLDIPLHLQPFEREFTEFHTRQLVSGNVNSLNGISVKVRYIN